LQLRQLITGVLALAAGIAIAYVDTRPTWDDAGITAGVLFVAAGLAALGGVRPLLAAVLVAGPMVLAEYRTAGPGLVIAPLIALVGAFGGWLARRTMARRASW